MTGPTRTRRRIKAVVSLAAWSVVAAACGGEGGNTTDLWSIERDASVATGTSSAAVASDDGGREEDAVAGDSGGTNGGSVVGADAGSGGGGGDADGGVVGADQGSGDSGSVNGDSGDGGGTNGGSGGEAGGGVEGAGPDPVIGPVGPVAPLTGVPASDPGLDQRRVLAVKVDNGERRSRPQTGLASADVVYEVLVEASRTRFLAVFHSEIPDRIGPVRSARSADVDLLADLGTPYLVSSGANRTVLGELRQAERSGSLIDIGAQQRYEPYSRDPSRPSPFNLYFNFPGLGGGAPDSLPGGGLDAPLEPLFNYGASSPPGLDDAVGVTVATRASGNIASHVWDARLGGWVRIQNGLLHTVETDFGSVEIAPANVVVVWTTHRTSAADSKSPQAVSYGSGDALVLTAGSVHEARWERTEGRAGFRFIDFEGHVLRLSPGSTWVLLVNEGGRFAKAEVSVLTASEGASMLYGARANAAQTGNGAGAS